MINIGLARHIQKLPRIGRQAFHIAALAFGIDRIKRQRRFARPRQPRDHHELVARNIHIDVLQIMLARAAHLDELLLSHDPPHKSGKDRPSRRGFQPESVNKG